jgi:hypothetical protein
MEQSPNIFKQILWIIIKPKLIFEKLKDKPSILIPIVLMIIAGIIVGISTSQVAGNIDYSGLQNIPPDQAAQVSDMMKSPIMTALMGIMGSIATIGKNIAGLFLKALIMWGLVYIFGGRGSYMQSASIVGFSWFPLFIRDIIQTIVGTGVNINEQLQSFNPVDVNFINFIKLNFGQQGILFVVWNMVLLTIGYSIVFNTSKLKTGFISAIYWIAGFFISSGIGWFTLQNTMKFTNMPG